MAEGFANHYGGDVLRATSAGLAPVTSIVAPTVATMMEKNVDVSLHVPRLYDPRFADRYDLVINMSGCQLPGSPPRNLREWAIADPYRSSAAVYRAVRDELEQKVMRVILELRKARG